MTDDAKHEAWCYLIDTIAANIDVGEESSAITIADAIEGLIRTMIEEKI